MTSRPLSWTMRMGLVYLILLALVTIYGFNTYGDLGQSATPSQNISEEHPLYPVFAAYGRFLVTASFVLGAFLGLYAAYAGLLVRRTSRSLMFLILGALLTAIPFSLLPDLQLPGGESQASIVWLGTGFYAYAPVWIGANLLAQFRRRGSSPPDEQTSRRM